MTIALLTAVSLGGWSLQRPSVSEAEWRQSSGKPILELGPTGNQDVAEVRLAEAIQDSNPQSIWYSGTEGSDWNAARFTVDHALDLEGAADPAFFGEEPDCRALGSDAEIEGSPDDVTVTVGGQVVEEGVSPAAASVTGTYVEFILDASGSMAKPLEGKTRLDVARQVMTDLIQSMPDEAQVGLRVYCF
jgi:hypothetical protein